MVRNCNNTGIGNEGTSFYLQNDNATKKHSLKRDIRILVLIAMCLCTYLVNNTYAASNGDIKVSIVVPVYKVEEYLDECMNSLINQTLKEIEIICVDDGSPDNCGKMLDEYAKYDDRITVVHQKNQGVSAARNAGINLAKGEYLTFVDPDDYVKLDTYEYLLFIYF